MLYMTSSIPNGFSFDQLQEMLESAQEANEQETLLYNGLTYEEVIAEAEDTLEGMTNPEPIVHKVMICILVNHMIEWHTQTGQHVKYMGDDNNMVAWLRDAGKWQAIMNILGNIGVCDNDFTMIQRQ